MLAYLSDRFGRRYMLLLAYIAWIGLAVGLGLIKHAVQMFVIRAFLNIATGAMGTLINITISDFVSLERRGRYQGIQGASVAVGGVMGTVGGAALGMHDHWRWLYYYFEALMAAFGLILVFFFVPAKVPPPSLGELGRAFSRIDWWGVITLTGAFTLGVILLSEAGKTSLANEVTMASVHPSNA